MGDTILVINAGSSSIKFQLFAVAAEGPPDRQLKGQIDGIGTRPRLRATDAKGESVAEESWSGTDVADLPKAFERLIAFLRTHIGDKLPVAIGHRVVHGGPDYSEPIAVDAQVLEKLERLSPLAPLHQPNNLAPIRIALERQPQMLQVACFDTGFHRGHPEVADRFAIPEELYVKGIRRYGFHGLSYEYITRRLHDVAPDVADRRIVVAHLGSGASMCAISGGRSIDSTMGFTALDGLPMGTRPGQLDAGVVLHLVSEGMSAKDIENLLYKDCGLKGLSGISNDVRELLESTDPRAKFALEYFTYRIALFAAQLTAAMEGIDALVFTAGIGENAPVIREAVLARLSWLGIAPAIEANRRNELCITRKDSRVRAYVVPTDEELMIAIHTRELMRKIGSAKLAEKRA